MSDRTTRRIARRSVIRFFAPTFVFGLAALAIALTGVSGPIFRASFFALAALAFGVSQLEQLRLWMAWRNGKDRDD